MAKLGPDVITEEINIDDDDPATDTDGAVETCVSVQCQKQIKGEILLSGLSDGFCQDRLSHLCECTGVSRGVSGKHMGLGRWFCG